MLCSCGGGKGNDAAAPAEKKVMTAVTDTCFVPFEYPAQLRGKQDISILPQVTGILTKVLVAEGDVVKQGQPMFLVDETSYRAAFDNCSASVEMARANVETQELELSATKQLFDKNVVSEHQYKVQMNTVMVAKAALAEAEAALKNARNDLNHTIVRSPHDGVVGNINFRQGSLVGPTIPEPLTIVSDNSTIYAYMSINSDFYLETVSRHGSKENMMANLPDMDLILGDGVVYKYKGRVETMSGIVDEHTGAVSVRVAFPNPSGILTAGGSGTVRAYFKYPGIVIPRSATYEIQDKHFAYKVVPSDSTFVAKSTAIDVYRLNETSYIVVDGLSDGDRIVLDGVKKMSDNMEILPKE